MNKRFLLIGVCIALVIVATLYWRWQREWSRRNAFKQTSEYRLVVPIIDNGARNGVGFAPAQSSEQTGEDAAFPIGPESFDVTDTGLLALADPVNNRVAILDVKQTAYSLRPPDNSDLKVLGFIQTAFSPERVHVRGARLLIQEYYHPFDRDYNCDLSQYRETRAAPCDAPGITVSLRNGEAAKESVQKNSLVNLVKDSAALTSFRSIGTDGDGHRFVLVHPKESRTTPSPYFARKYSTEGVLMESSPELSADGDIDPDDDVRVDTDGTVYWLTVSEKSVTVQVWRSHGI